MLDYNLDIENEFSSQVFDENSNCINANYNNCIGIGMVDAFLLFSPINYTAFDFTTKNNSVEMSHITSNENSTSFRRIPFENLFKIDHRTILTEFSNLMRPMNEIEHSLWNKVIEAVGKDKTRKVIKKRSISEIGKL